MAHTFPADLIDYSTARRLIGAGGWLLEKLGGPDLMLAVACFRLRDQYQLIFADGEQISIPLALLFRLAGWIHRPRLVTIAHVLSVRKKMIFLDIFRVHKAIDLFWVYCSWQKEFIQRRWRLPAERVVFTPFMVDSCFFAPWQVQADEPLPGIPENGDRPVLCSVGLEYRDYATLIEAVRGLDVQVVIAAASPWSKRPDTTQELEIPPNVTVRRFSQYELRSLYARSSFVVMPLFPVDFQAGVTTLLEAMAMEKAVICTRTPGQTDVVIGGETGLYVEPGDPDGLRAAIERLLDNREEAQEMGRKGRRRVEQEMSLERYVSRLIEDIERIP